MMEVNIMNPEQTVTHATVDSVREKDFNLNFCTTKKEILFDCRNKGESLSFAHTYPDA